MKVDLTHDEIETAIEGLERFREDVDECLYFPEDEVDARRIMLRSLDAVIEKLRTAIRPVKKSGL